MQSVENPLAARESTGGGPAAGTPYDWCIVFPKEAFDPGGRGTDVVQSIQAAHCKIYLYWSHDKDQVFLLIRVPDNVMQTFADAIDYRVLLR